MPPHPEVPAALRRLRDHGFRLVTLIDNTLGISGRQHRHKPAPTSGRRWAPARQAGRPRSSSARATPHWTSARSPTYIGNDLDAIADQLVERYVESRNGR
jgi:2-haloacid dehalogenase